MSRAHLNRQRRSQRGGQLPQLLRGVNQALHTKDRFRLLAEASQYLEATRSRPTDELMGRDQNLSTDDWIQTLVEVDLPATTGMLAALGVLTSGKRQKRIASALSARTVPEWLADLGEVEVTGVVQLGHLFDDGDDFVVGVRWKDGEELAALVYVDHNLGTMVKDAFVIPEPPTSIADRFRSLAEAEETIGMNEREVDPADARARIEQAIADGDLLLPPVETDTWPQCRPLVEWIVGRLPDGGQEYDWPEWSDEELDDIVDGFFASEHGRALKDTGDHRDLVHTLLWMAGGYSPCDPLRWSPVSVEIVMLDRFPRKVMGAKTYMNKMPKVLKALIRYSHDQKGLPGELTEETISTVDGYRDEYRSIVADDGRAAGAQAIAQYLRELDLDE